MVSRILSMVNSYFYSFGPKLLPKILPPLNYSETLVSSFPVSVIPFHSGVVGALVLTC